MRVKSWIVPVLLLAPAGARAQDAEDLRSLLARTAKAEERFWDQVSSISCQENLTQEKLGPSSKVLVKRGARFNYLILMQASGDDLTFEESRREQGTTGKATEQPLLVTGGFSVLGLIFHPVFAASFVFRERPSPDPALRLVEFEQIHGQRSPSALELGGRTYPIEWKGTATIERKTADVVSIQAALGTPMDDVGLKSLSAEVHYAAVVFKDPPGRFWLPLKAEVEAETRRQHWRNVHEFAAYLMFSVNTEVTIGKPAEEDK